MKKEELKNDAVVCHVKYGRYYRIMSCKMRFKDKTNGWTDGVTYAPLYPNEHECFTRELGSFLEEFEVVKGPEASAIFERWLQEKLGVTKVGFTSDEIDRARLVCLLCPELGGSGYCNKVKSDSIVFKYDKCDKLKEGLK